MNEVAKSTGGDDAFELGELLGRRRAFSAIAGRCSGADAECLRRMRNTKTFLKKASSWEEFCRKYVGMSKSKANQLIQYLEEFGPEYFDVAQMTRITPAQYRGIAPAIRDKTIHWQGEAIALIPENSEKVAAAVSDLRSKTELPADPEMPARVTMDGLVKDCEKLIARFEEVASRAKPYPEKRTLAQIRAHILQKLNALDLSA